MQRMGVWQDRQAAELLRKEAALEKLKQYGE
jgi:hypothetical protein